MKALLCLVLTLWAGSALADSFDPKIMPGRWTSPRHDYIYKGDGTWSMWPEEPGTTHGTWKIEGDKLIEATSTGESQTLTIKKLSFNEILLSDGTRTYRMERTANLPTPEPSAKSTSPERTQIMDALRMDFYQNKELAQKNPQGIKFVVKYYKVKGDWACVHAVPTQNGKEVAEPRWAVLHKANGEWRDLDYARRIMIDDMDALQVLSFTGNTSARVVKAIPGVPREILP